MSDRARERPPGDRESPRGHKLTGAPGAGVPIGRALDAEALTAEMTAVLLSRLGGTIGNRTLQRMITAPATAPPVPLAEWTPPEPSPRTGTTGASTAPLIQMKPLAALTVGARPRRPEAAPLVAGKPVAVQRVAPLVAAGIWVAKAGAATTLDAVIDAAIAALTGIPPPGFWGHVGNFFINLVPGLGEAKKLKKAAKLVKVIDNIVDVVRTLDRLKVPGAASLLKAVAKESDRLKAAIKNVDVEEAKKALFSSIGYLREAQVASKAHEAGTLVSLSKKVKKGKQLVGEIDLVTEEGGKMVFNQVKAGKAAVQRPRIVNGVQKNKEWDRFTKQADYTLEEAKANGGIARFVVDEISDEAREYLTGKGIDIKLTSEVVF